jgi:4-amino-4-deoxy-L-arabinose transferase-like glycosyltransferase
MIYCGYAERRGSFIRKNFMVTRPTAPSDPANGEPHGDSTTSTIEGAGTFARLQRPIDSLLKIGMMIGLPAILAGIVVSFAHFCLRNGWPVNGLKIPACLLAVVAALVLFRARIPFPRPSNKSIVIIFIIGLLLRFVWICSVRNEQKTDFAIFHELAVSLCQGTGYSYTGPVGLADDVGIFLHKPQATPPVATAFRLPGTSLLLAGVYLITGPSQFAGKCFYALLSALIGVLLFLLLRRTQSQAAVAAALFWELYPSAIAASGVLSSELPVTVGFLVSAVILQHIGGRRRHVRFILWGILGVAAGCTALIRPVTQFLLLIPLVVFLIENRPSRALLATGITLLGMALPLCAWGARNFHRFGVFEWQTPEMGMGGHTLTREFPIRHKDPALDSLVDRCEKCADEFEIARLGAQIGKLRFKHAIAEGSYFLRIPHNFMKTWRDDTDWLNWSTVYTGERVLSSRAHGVLYALMQCFYLLLILLAIKGSVTRQFRRALVNRGLLLLLIYLVGTQILVISFEGQPRYHFPMMPLVVIMAALALKPAGLSDEGNRLPRESGSTSGRR